MVDKALMRQTFDGAGNHTLENTATGEKRRASYTGWAYLDGWVSCTNYYTGKGEAIMTADEFCKMAGSNYLV